MDIVEVLENLFGGIFSYIEDRVTAISYRHSDRIFDYTIGSSHFKDYSKNWRELLYIDIQHKAFVASRQYPCYNEEISKQVREMLEQLICDKYSLKNSWKVLHGSDSGMFRNYIDDCDNPLHYNDMLNGFEGKIVFNKELDNLSEVAITVGTNPTCPICGDDDIQDSEKPVCCDCWDEYGLYE